MRQFAWDERDQGGMSGDRTAARGRGPPSISISGAQYEQVVNKFYDRNVRCISAEAHCGMRALGWTPHNARGETENQLFFVRCNTGLSVDPDNCGRFPGQVYLPHNARANPS